MTDHEQQRRREQFLQRMRDAQEMWKGEVTSPAGPLPGALLDVLEHGDGCWSVPASERQAGLGRPAQDVPTRG